MPSASASNHNAGITVAKSVQTATGPIIGMAQAAPGSKEISFDIDMTADLLANGSLTLVAEVQNFPSALAGGAYPLLVSLNDDGTTGNELINIGGNCATNGYYTCSGGVCSVNTSCTISQPSAYMDRTHWEQRQAPNISAVGSPSSNIFPTCNWTGGTSGSATVPNCAFNGNGVTGFFGVSNPPRLKSGTTYKAKYVLVADSYSSISSSQTATIQLTIYKRTTPATVMASAGAIDLNVVLVGDSNVVASRTDKGKQNLNTLIESVSGYFSQTNANVKIGTVNAVEWSCSGGGDVFASMDVDDLGTMLAAGSQLVPASSEGKALNLFLVSEITDGSSSSGFTILGFDGAIGGPPLNATATSGLTAASFDAIDTFNSECTDSSAAVCALAQQDESFQTLGVVLAHEIGHFLGLNHLTESGGDEHDGIYDTPVCTATGASSLITIASCLNTDVNIYAGTGLKCGQSCASYNSSTGTFCPTAVECSFNHLMWWTTKNFSASTDTGDGNILSVNTGVVLNYNPLVQ